MERPKKRVKREDRTPGFVVELGKGGEIPWDQVKEIYQKYQVVVCRKCVDTSGFNLSVVKGIYDNASPDVKETFCIENAGDTSSSFAGPQKTLPATVGGSWYSSFIVQKDESTLKLVYNALPLLALEGFYHSDVVWFFCGKNTKKMDLAGRPEHTDSVTNDGTWHLQTSGKKIWQIRPTDELLKRNNVKEISKGTKFVIECSEGDVLLVNTKAWWHQTRIPCTNTAKDNVSVSYARDIWLKPPSQKLDELTDMTNVDGLYAPHSISCGDIVLTEDDIPDCELPRSQNPNCEVDVMDGKGVLVALRDIATGEFFSVSPSSDEDCLSSEDEENE